jgi:hypothetical protein
MTPNADYVIPSDLADADIWVRIAWLLKDAENDDRMAGVPRYQRRYTAREHEIITFIRFLMMPLVMPPNDGSRA